MLTIFKALEKENAKFELGNYKLNMRCENQTAFLVVFKETLVSGILRRESGPESNIRVAHPLRRTNVHP